MAMLHFLHSCLNGNTSQKKMFFKIHVLYIDEARGVYGHDAERAAANCAVIADACTRYGFALTIIPFEKVFEIERDSRNEPREDMDHAKYKRLDQEAPQLELNSPDKLDEYRGRMQVLFGSLEASFAADIAKFLKKWLIAEFCLKNNFKRVLFATTGHQIATQLLA